MIIGLVLLLIGATNFTYEKMPTLLAWGVPCGLIVFGAVMHERLKPAKSILKASWLGDSSYTLYLSHMLIIKYLFSFDLVHIYASKVYGEIVVIGITIVSIICSIYVYKYVEAPLLVFIKNFGQRKIIKA